MQSKWVLNSEAMEHKALTTLCRGVYATRLIGATVRDRGRLTTTLSRDHSWLLDTRQHVLLDPRPISQMKKVNQTLLRRTATSPERLPLPSPALRPQCRPRVVGR